MGNSSHSYIALPSTWGHT